MASITYTNCNLRQTYGKHILASVFIANKTEPIPDLY